MQSLPVRWFSLQKWTLQKYVIIYESSKPTNTVREKKRSKVILLSFHEFLSDLLHIYRVNSWGMEVLLGTQKFRFLTHKQNIFTKRWISIFSKMAIFGGVMSKIEFKKIGYMDMSYIMESSQNGSYTTFPNFFSLISAESADLSHNQKKHFFQKKSWFFDRKSALERPKRVR